MSDQNNPSADPRGLKKYLRIDAALFIASMLGAFTLSGFAHLEKFYLTLDVPIERLNISAQQYLSYGASGFGSFLSALFFAVALVGIVSLLILLFEKENWTRPNLPHRQNGSPMCVNEPQKTAACLSSWVLFSCSRFC
ncbi:hypothetical protein LJJ44_08020 [Pseudomonas sp. B24_DOA]|nr:hypothetical protein LJJ44_08020 [Pseudomonas sp. B24_DOA]WKV87278.1 hypothetical protein LJU32_16040 [Pseudomonas sp. B21_DOA]